MGIACILNAGQRGDPDRRATGPTILAMIVPVAVVGLGIAAEPWLDRVGILIPGAATVIWWSSNAWRARLHQLDRFGLTSDAIGRCFKDRRTSQRREPASRLRFALLVVSLPITGAPKECENWHTSRLLTPPAILLLTVLGGKDHGDPIGCEIRSSRNAA